MFLIVKKNVVDGVFCFTKSFKYMEVITLDLNFPFFKSLGKGDGEGPHAFGEDLVIICLGDEVDVIVLKRKVDNP